MGTQWIDLDPTKRAIGTKRIEKYIRLEFVGQDAPLQGLLDAHSRSMSRLRDPQRPAFFGLFLGSSAVGKSMLAKKLAEALIYSSAWKVNKKAIKTNERTVTKINCEHHKEVHKASTILGSSLGYVDSQKDSLLSQWYIDNPALERILPNLELTDPVTKMLSEEWDNVGRSLHEASQAVDVHHKKDLERAVRRKLLKHVREQSERLWSVILFDEIEKAHADFQDILLSIAEDGKITMGNTEETSFRDSFIICTSNLGSVEIADKLRGVSSIGFGKGEADTQDIKEIVWSYLEKSQAGRTGIKPELLSRYGEHIYIFELLENEHYQKILTNNLKKQVDLIELNHKVEITITDAARKVLLKRSQENRSHGVRSLGAAIRTGIENSLANIINSGQVSPEEKVLVDFIEGKFIFKKLVCEEEALASQEM